jgi:hypothetical protein
VLDSIRSITECHVMYKSVTLKSLVDCDRGTVIFMILMSSVFVTEQCN